jgi:hypothetical protein
MGLRNTPHPSPQYLVVSRGLQTPSGSFWPGGSSPLGWVDVGRGWLGQFSRPDSHEEHVSFRPQAAGRNASTRLFVSSMCVVAHGSAPCQWG